MGRVSSLVYGPSAPNLRSTIVYKGRTRSTSFSFRSYVANHSSWNCGWCLVLFAFGPWIVPMSFLTTLLSLFLDTWHFHWKVCLSFQTSGWRRIDWPSSERHTQFRMNIDDYHRKTSWYKQDFKDRVGIVIYTIQFLNHIMIIGKRRWNTILLTISWDFHENGKFIRSIMHRSIHYSRRDRPTKNG